MCPQVIWIFDFNLSYKPFLQGSSLYKDLYVFLLHNKVSTTLPRAPSLLLQVISVCSQIIINGKGLSSDKSFFKGPTIKMPYNNVKCKKWAQWPYQGHQGHQQGFQVFIKSSRTFNLTNVGPKASLSRKRHHGLLQPP